MEAQVQELNAEKVKINGEKESFKFELQQLKTDKEKILKTTKKH